MSVPRTPGPTCPPVLVVGASGNVGAAVVEGLLARGVPVRAGGTDPVALSRRFPCADAVRLDLTDPGTFDAAVAGAGGVFLVRPPAISRVGPTLNALVDAARTSGARHVVFSSVAGAESDRLVPHHRVETHLKASGLGWTILRPGFFMQNIADAYRDDVVHDRRIPLPAGDGMVAFIDARDIGEVAASALAAPEEHLGAEYLLTGPRALDLHELAALLGAELGEDVTYEPLSALAYLRHVVGQGRPLTQAVVQTVLHVGLRRGDAEAVGPTLGRLLGRQPRTVESYLHEHRHLWAAASPDAART